jgi:hypothetical protein
MSKVAADNDVLYKGAWYGLLRQLVSAIPSVPAETMILGQARFVVAKRLERHARKGVANAQRALEHFSALLAELSLSEPTPQEQSFAARLENAAQNAGLALDSGESLLCAMTIERDLARLATGDKRAIHALEILAREQTEMATVAGKILCLEQLFVRLLATEDPTAIQKAVCADHHADRALAMCFGCSSPEVGPDQWIAGLSSYIEAIRADAPTMLSGTIAQE